MSDQPFESKYSSDDPPREVPNAELLAIATENAVTLQALLLAAQDHARKLDEALRAMGGSGISPIAIAAEAGLKCMFRPYSLAGVPWTSFWSS